MKNFDEWNELKKEIDSSVSKTNVFFDKREVWWSTLGINIGFEQDGKGEYFRRPVLILSKLSKDLLIVLPLTTKNKKGSWYVECVSRDFVFRVAILAQVKVIDSGRLIDFITKAEIDSFAKIKNAFIDLL